MIDVSFVVIAYNEEHNIAATVRSILAQEKLGSFEVIVVDDGSRDSTAAVVKKMAKKHAEINLISKANGGRGAARATGVAAATGKFIAFVDADIILPPRWLQTCRRALKSFDGVGGVAVPDGDVAFVHRLFSLSPKPALPTTAITGNNGCFKRKVFAKVGYNPTKKDGEDVDLVYQMQAAGFTSACLPELLVEHHESKSYRESLKWLFVSGRGAARQFYEHRQLRLPDIAFAGFLGLFLAALLSFVWSWQVALVLLAISILYAFGTSALHLLGKFLLLQKPLHGAAAIIVNAGFMLAYYTGRAEGLVSQVRYYAK